MVDKTKEFLRSPNSPAGVTLVELLVGLAVGLLLAGLLFSAYFQTVRVWSNTEARILRSRQLEIVTEVIGADLSRAVSYGGIASLSMVGVGGPNTRDEDPGSRQLHFLSAVRNEGQTEVCGISYRCEFDEQMGGYALHRYVLNSDTVVARLAMAKGESEGRVSDPNVVFQISAKEAVGERIAAYLWNFQPALLDREGEEIRTVFDGSMPRAVRISFYAAAAMPERRERVRELERPYWNIPTSHFFQKAFAGTALEVTRTFQLPAGWSPAERPTPAPGEGPPTRKSPSSRDYSAGNR